MDVSYTVHSDLNESSNAMKSGPIPGYYLSNHHHPHHPSQHMLTEMVSYSDSALIHSQPLFPPTSYHSSLHHNHLYGPSASYPVSSNSYWNHPSSSSSSTEFISPTGSSGSDSCLLVMPFDQHPPSSLSPTSTQSGSPGNYIPGINYRLSHSSGLPLINQHYSSIPFEHTIESDGTSSYNHHQMMQESLDHSQDPVTSSKKSLTTRRRNSQSKDMTPGTAIMTVGQKPTKKERRRTVCINSAFSRLRERIPNVPVDTKLSKIKTLKLAKQYIEYLAEKLKEDPISTETSEASCFVGRPEEGFRADLTRYKRSRNSSHSVASSTCTSHASVGETRNMETACFSMGLPRGRNRRVNNNKETFTITTRNMIASQHKISLRAVSILSQR